MSDIAFLGLGAMGYPMAGHLATAGHPVRVYNRTTSKAEAFTQQFGAQHAATPARAAAGADIVIACVGNDQDLEEITLGSDGAFSAMSQGSIFVDHTTTSANLARRLYAEAQQRGFHFVDAPVSGGQAGAEKGQLSIMMGGDSGPIEKLQPMLSCYSRIAERIGATGCGQLTKMVNQICIAGLLQGLAEGLNFATAAELDTTQVLKVISKGAAQSWQMDNRAKTMLQGQFDFGFAVDWMRKDLTYVLEEANNTAAQLPVTELVHQYYAEVHNLGGGRWDTSSLITRLDPRFDKT
jgi:3-hydroxyisobutyrate dehydrogenase